MFHNVRPVDLRNGDHSHDAIEINSYPEAHEFVGFGRKMMRCFRSVSLAELPTAAY